ncbi:MAG: hypothetical protein ACLVEX_14645, partial [Ruthenibacterium lactatiformans]
AFDGKPGPEALVLRGLTAGAVPAGAHPVAAAGVVLQRPATLAGGGRRPPRRAYLSLLGALLHFCC